jgi:hypothetical protein
MLHFSRDPMMANLCIAGVSPESLISTTVLLHFLHSPATQLTNVKTDILCTPRCFIHIGFEFFDVDIIFFQS